MKAQVLYNVNDLRWEEKALDRPAKDWVLVRVEAAGICGSDIPRIYKTGAHRHPLIPGHEFSGQVCTVEETQKQMTEKDCFDEEAQKKWEKKRVGIFPLIPCGECACCKKKQYEMCSNYNYLGSRCDGGFAQYAFVPTWNLLALPEEISFEMAAMLEPFAVAAHSVRRVQAKKDAYVIVWGLGTIGLMTVMLLKAEGVENIIAVGNKTIQEECIRQIGDEIVFINALEDAAQEKISAALPEGKAEVFFECVGKNETILEAIKRVMPGGVIQLVGNPYSDMQLPKEVYWQILRKQITLYGTWNSSYTGEETDDWHYVVRMMMERKIHPEILITHRYSLSELQQGLVLMRDKTEEFIKIMMVRSEQDEQV